MKKQLSIFAVLCFISIISLNAQETNNIKIERPVFEKFEKIIIRNGEQKIIHSLPIIIDVGYGSVNSYLFELRDIKSEENQVFKFSSIVNKNEFYAPTYILLNKDYQMISIIDDEINIKSNGLSNPSQTTDININSNVKYILQTTKVIEDSASFDHQSESANLVGIYTGSSMVYVPMGSTSSTREIVFSKTPKTKVLSPIGKNIQPLQRDIGIYGSIGVNFGGERVADNPDGDDYRAGGGAVFMFGYSHIMFRSSFTVRAGVGYRYQGSKKGNASNQGGIGEAVLSFQTRYISFGIGGNYDFANKIVDMENKSYRFNNQIGPKAVLDIRFGSMITMGLEYIMTNYTTTNSSYRGNQIALSVKFFSGSL